nr:histidine phosphatase family protein [Pseudomonas sp. R-28-1W-6]
MIRHGESSANAGHPTDDPYLIDLTELGRQQAADVAESFREPPDLIIHSPMRRAVMTAMPTMQRFPGVPVLDMDIQEFTYLDPVRCQGTTAAERKAWVEAYWAAGNVESYDDGFDALDALAGNKPRCESFIDFVGRVNRFAVTLTEGLAGFQRIAVFGHGQHLLRTHIELTRIYCVDGHATWDARYMDKRGYQQVESDMRAFPSLLREMHLGNAESEHWLLDAPHWRKVSGKENGWAN